MFEISPENKFISEPECIDADDADAKPNYPSPLKSIRQYCKTCCGGSSMEIALCPSVGCPLHPFRMGRKPKVEEAMAIDDAPTYPEEYGVQLRGSARRPATQGELRKAGLTSTRAIKRYCIDCSGGSITDAKKCRYTDCPLHPYREGKSPNRRLSPKQSANARERLAQARLVRSRGRTMD